MRKLLKLLHTLGACGLIGGLAGFMVLLAVAPQDTPQAVADARRALAALSSFVLIPSLAVTLISGVFSLSIHRPFHDMGWVWAKALLGLAMFEGTLVIIGGRSRKAAEIAQDVADGAAPAAALETALRNEWAGVIAILALAVANVVLGVWRPRFQRRRRPEVGGA